MALAELTASYHWRGECSIVADSCVVVVGLCGTEECKFHQVALPPGNSHLIEWKLDFRSVNRKRSAPARYDWANSPCS